MLFDGDELKEILSRTPNGIEFRNEYGRRIRVLGSTEALALDLDLFIGVGNRRRIRFLRRRSQRFMISSGSRTTRRLRNAAGLMIAHPLIRDHRPPFPPSGVQSAPVGHDEKVP